MDSSLLLGLYPFSCSQCSLAGMECRSFIPIDLTNDMANMNTRDKRMGCLSYWFMKEATRTCMGDTMVVLWFGRHHPF